MNFSLTQLSKQTAKKKKRLGQGRGSGKGAHTSSRGAKGQNARSKVSPLFEGTKTNKDFFRKVPMLRGKGKLKSSNPTPVIVKLSQLMVFAEGDTVTLESLVVKNIVANDDALSRGVKVLFDMNIGKKLTLRVPASAAVLALM